MQRDVQLYRHNRWGTQLLWWQIVTVGLISQLYSFELNFNMMIYVSFLSKNIQLVEKMPHENLNKHMLLILNLVSRL